MHPTKGGVTSRAMRYNQRVWRDKLPTDHWRPQTRGDCATFARPCPYVGCRYHLYLDVGAKGGLRFNYGDDVEKALQVMPYTCALDAAEEGLERSDQKVDRNAICTALNISVERQRQISVASYQKLASNRQLREQASHLDEPDLSPGNARRPAELPDA